MEKGRVGDGKLKAVLTADGPFFLGKLKARTSLMIKDMPYFPTSNIQPLSLG